MAKFSIKNLNKEQRELRKRILEISHESRLSHLGSCLSAVDIIDAVYKVKKHDDIFILSNGHAGVAWYVVLEKFGYIPNAKTIKKLNIHPDRNPKYDIHVSTGSLGQGLPIALGMAYADKKKQVYCMLSDGECTEGSIWEALRVASDRKINNLKIIVNANGWSAYDKVHLPNLQKRFKSFGFTVKKTDGHDPKNLKSLCKEVVSVNPLLIFAKTHVDQFPFLKGQDAHYYVMKDEDFNLAIRQLQ
jgi:transketolase